MTPATAVRAKNQVLSALPPLEWRRIQPQLECVELRQGAMLHESGVVPRHVYFPETAIISLVTSVSDGASAEVAVVGNEGVVGTCAFLGGGSALGDAVVQSAGYVFRITAQSIACHAAQSEALMREVLRYTQGLIAHIAQTAICNRHHALDQRLCRWLLHNLDRRDSMEMTVTQEQIANMLGVRREAVTGSAMKLQKAGLIQYQRGRVAILDRAGLQAASCECYSVVRQEYDRLWAHSARQWRGGSRERSFPSDGGGLWAANA